MKKKVVSVVCAHVDNENDFNTEDKSLSTS